MKLLVISIENYYLALVVKNEFSLINLLSVKLNKYKLFYFILKIKKIRMKQENQLRERQNHLKYILAHIMEKHL